MNLGPLELAVIVGIALLIFGPKNLPKLGSAMGKTVKNIRKGMESSDEEQVEVVEEYDEDEDEEPAPVKKRTVKKTTRKKVASKKED